MIMRSISCRAAPAALVVAGKVVGSGIGALRRVGQAADLLKGCRLLAQKLMAHKKQLSLYADALLAMTGTPVSSRYVYLLSIGEAVRVDG